jgi:formylglycine-generating enzyme required for sulfatase activity
MLLVPPGTFQMGCLMGTIQGNFCSSFELPVHAVTLTRPYYLGRYEVTQAQWTATMGSNPSYFVAANGYPGSDNRPVEQVKWAPLQTYLAQTGLRLPTEAEWERACRAGTDTPYYNGSVDDTTLGDIAWYSANSGGGPPPQTHEVGGKAPNALGFHDMLGNVRERVPDFWSSYRSGPQTDPTGGIGDNRVMRGGSWGRIAAFTRSSSRDVVPETATSAPDYQLGFRVARTP